MKHKLIISILFSHITTYTMQSTKVPTINKQLLQASASGNLTELESLLQKKADPNTTDENNFTPIMYAANKDIVKTLLHHGGKTDITNKMGYTPLMLAVISGRIPTIETLLSSGTNVNAENLTGDTALTIATMKANTAVVKLLIKKGAEVNQINKYGYTPIRYATREYHIDIIKTLLKVKANIPKNLNPYCKKIKKILQEAKNLILLAEENNPKEDEQKTQSQT